MPSLSAAPLRAAFAFAVCLAAAPALADAPAQPWSGHGVSARFPWVPKEQAANGATTVSAANPDDTIAYMISILPVAQAVLKQKGGNQLLLDAIDGATKQVKGKAQGIADVKLGKLPGKRFQIVADAGFIADCRLYLDGNRMVLPMVIYKPGLPLPMGAAAFHDQLRIAAAR